ncbi:MAG TPA: DinB family protein [Blastocatellia bacterium]|nr:DinB family protein [Blastocatellia bacterium]
MSIETLIETWKDVRKGVIAEVSKIPPDKFEFKATPDTRTVAEITAHIIGTQALLVGEMCRSDTNLMRAPFPDMVKQYSPELSATKDKDGLLKLLTSGQEAAAEKIQAFGEEGLKEQTRRFDGKMITKLALLHFSYSHEMYHRGQLAVYERLLNIEPALTTRFKELLAARQ